MYTVATELKFRIDSDGSLATVGSTMWRDFLVKAGLNEKDHISFLIFKEMSCLVVCFEDMSMYILRRLTSVESCASITKNRNFILCFVLFVREINTSNATMNAMILFCFWDSLVLVTLLFGRKALCFGINYEF